MFPIVPADQSLWRGSLSATKEYLSRVLTLPPAEAAEEMLELRDHFLEQQRSPVSADKTSAALAKRQRKEQKQQAIADQLEQREQLIQRFQAIRWQIFRVEPEVSRKKLRKVKPEELDQHPDLKAYQQQLLELVRLVEHWPKLRYQSGMSGEFLDFCEEWLPTPPSEASSLLVNFLHSPEISLERRALNRKSAKILRKHLGPDSSVLQDMLQPFSKGNLWNLPSSKRGGDPYTTFITEAEHSIPRWVLFVLVLLVFKVLSIYFRNAP